jgi:three-Cys-motif partner protein
MANPSIPRPIRKWTAIKLEYLDYYLQGYVKATQTARETHYIDLFASCGECVIKENGQYIQGSSWRALNTVPKFGQYHFIEKNPILAAYLSKSIQDKGFENVRVYPGDCNVVIPQDILPNIPRDVPCFAFLDPEGLQLNWATVKALAAHRLTYKVELLILYPYDMAVSRNMFLAKTKHATASRLTSFYGDESWKLHLEQSIQLIENTIQRRQRFVSLFQGKLTSLGYKYVEVYGPLCSNRGPLYHVVFASDHYVGTKIMRDVWSRTRFVPGELGYNPIKRPMA